jgi:peptidoglycan/LPS O-acetylase OafA/YrhL
VRVKRYETLDALRGVAAIMVVLYNLGVVKLEPGLVPHGYLAVDFFFVLSGFVVAHAYEGALQASLPWRAFFLKRLIRLWPIAALGAAMGLAILLMKYMIYPSKVDALPIILTSGFFNFLMLPTFFGGAASQHCLFPGDPPLWSLFFDVAVNMLWAWIGIWMRTWAISAIAVASGVVLVLAAPYLHSLDAGWNVTTFWVGTARVCFGFPLGVVIYRLRAEMCVPSWRFGPIVLGTLLVAAMAFPLAWAPDRFPWWDLLCIAIVMPVIIVCAVGQQVASAVGNWLGCLSYPVYVLHCPVVLLASGLYQTKFSHVNVHVLSVMSLGVVIAAAAAASRFYEEPARRALSTAAMHLASGNSKKNRGAQAQDKCTAVPGASSIST